MPLLLVAPLLLALFAAPARAQDGCTILCTPSIRLEPGLVVTNLGGGPEVRLLPDGPVVELESEPHFVMVVTATIPTELERVSLVTALYWRPWDGTGENPFTDYTADQLDEEEVRGNSPQYEAGVVFTVVRPASTNGWFALDVGILDQFSPAAEPDDEAAYTHKLNLEAGATLGIFNWLDDHVWLSDVNGYATLDYVATGLPDEGDEVPDDEQVFLDDANPWTLYLGVSIPFAPLDPEG